MIPTQVLEFYHENHKLNKQLQHLNKFVTTVNKITHKLIISVQLNQPPTRKVEKQTSIENRKKCNHSQPITQHIQIKLRITIIEAGGTW